MKYILKKHLMYVAGMMILMLVCNGCVIIPVGWDTYSKNVIGARADSEGNVCEQIVHYNKRLKFIAIGITPEGPIVGSYFDYSRYAAMNRNSTKAIWAMEHFPSLAATRVTWAHPIPNSDRWITCEENGCTEDEVDITLIVFSVKNGKILRHRFEHAKRCGPRDAKTICYYIEGNADLSCLRVHEKDKITRVNTVTGEIVTETDDSPPFYPAAIDWNAWEKLLKQPMLRP